MEKVNNKIVVPKFYEDRDIYESDLGWQKLQKEESRSYVSRDIFEFEIVLVGLNLSFYYVDNDTFYGLHTEMLPIEFKILPRDRSEKYIGWQCDGDTHQDGEVLYSFEERTMEMWDTIRIDGKSLEEVLERSYILALN